MEETGRCGSTERGGGYDHCLTDFSGSDGHGPCEKWMDGWQAREVLEDIILFLIFFFYLIFFPSRSNH
jgi:hypothetical protein